MTNDTAKRALPTYKDVKTLMKFVDERGKIQSRVKSGLTAREQRVVSQEIKRARHLALMPFTQTVR